MLVETPPKPVIREDSEPREHMPERRGSNVPQRSVIIPVYNGSASVAGVVHDLLQELSDRSTEVILVNDGSPDDSERCCRELVDLYPGRVTLVQLSRNFGEYAAVLAGLRQCLGDTAVIVDDDGQQPPDEVRRLLETVEREHFDVVYGRYLVRRQAWWRRWAGQIHNLGACFFLDKPRGLYLSSFKAMNRFMVLQISNNAGANPYFDGLIFQISEHLTQIDVLHRRRRTGRSSYSFAMLLRVWFDMCIGFSTKPYRMATLLGAVLAVAGAIGLSLGPLAVDEASFSTLISTSWRTCLSGGVLFYLGLTGEHILRGVGRSRPRPPYVVRYIYRAGVTYDE